MSFFNEVLLARTVQGTLESVIGRSKQRLVVTFPSNLSNPIKLINPLTGATVPIPPITQTTQFDIMQSFNYKQSVKITENPVEQGVNINDHRIQQPLQLQIQVGTSNIIDPITAATELDAGSLIQAIALQIVGNRIANGRIQATYKQLQNAMYNSEVFDLDTPMGLIQNLVISEIENTNDDESITTFEGLITMREILYFNNLKNPSTQVSGVSERDIVLRSILTPTVLQPGGIITS